LWEGGYDGEKYSQQLKHQLKGGLKRTGIDIY
jgi:phosphomannomutase